MKIFICASKHNYDKVLPVKEKLEKLGHIATVPNSFDEPMKEEDMKKEGANAHADWKVGMIRLQDEKVAANDAVLILNFDKGDQKNYIGGSTFLETYKAFERSKKIYFYNPLPESIFKDELLAMRPVVIEGDLTKIT